MLQILDATLREGEQTPGVYFDEHIKLAIAAELNKLGIDIIEAGHPLVSSEIKFAVTQIANNNFKSIVGAHARSLKQDVDLALECGVGLLGIFYCVSNSRLSGVFNKDIGAAIAQITEVIAYAKSQKPDLLVRYTPEDTVRSNFQNVLDASVAAVQAGADIISIADTTGYMIPGTKRSMYAYVKKLKDELAERDAYPKIAVHCHNDRGFALTNAIDGYRAGADIIDATILGMGERAGIVDLAQLLVTLKLDFEVANDWDLSKLNNLYHLVSQNCGIPIPMNFPITGQNAFTHCAGVHTHAAAKDPAHYQSLDPAVVGRKMDISLDHMSGIASIKWALDKLGIIAENDLLERILKKVKSIGQRGRTVGLTELEYIVEWCKKHEIEG